MLVNVHEAKSRLSTLIAKAEAGEEVVIARANRPVVRLVPIEPPTGCRRLGEAKGLVVMRPDFNDLPEEFLGYFK